MAKTSRLSSVILLQLNLAKLLSNIVYDLTHKQVWIFLEKISIQVIFYFEINTYCLEPTLHRLIFSGCQIS